MATPTSNPTPTLVTDSIPACRTGTTARPGRHVRIGRGAHSEVWRRPGSPWVIQIFRPESPLTVRRLTFEFDRLRAEYAAMPDLIGPQRLFSPSSHPSGPVAVPLHEMLLVKQFVDVDPTIALLRARAENLTEAQHLQLAQFITITRGLLTLPLAGDVPQTGVPRLPDIIDDDFRNLAFDRTGTLRLLDTNELISTAHLYDLLGTCETLDVHHRVIHAKFFARLLLLETLIGRGRRELRTDPLYRGYLTAEQIDALLRGDPTAPAGGGR